EGHAVDCLTVQADRAGRHRQAHPAAGRWQSAYVLTAGRAVAAPADVVGAPVGAVLPAATDIPLAHHLLRRGRPAMRDIGVQRIAGVDRHGLRHVVEVVLMLAGSRVGLLILRAGVGARVAATPGPGIAAVGSEPGADRRTVFDPDDAAGRLRPGGRLVG